MAAMTNSAVRGFLFGSISSAILTSFWLKRAEVPDEHVEYEEGTLHANHCHTVHNLFENIFRVYIDCAITYTLSWMEFTFGCDVIRQAQCED